MATPGAPGARERRQRRNLARVAAATASYAAREDATKDGGGAGAYRGADGGPRVI